MKWNHDVKTREDTRPLDKIDFKWEERILLNDLRSFQMRSPSLGNVPKNIS